MRIKYCAAPLSWSPDHPSLLRGCRWRPRPSWRNPSAKHSFSRACARCLHRRSLGEGFCNPTNGAPITWENLPRTSSRFVILVSRGLFGQEACKGLFSLFGCLRHACKKAGRAFYQPRTTGAIDFPPPGLRRTPSSLHDERIVGRVKSFTHAS